MLRIHFTSEDLLRTRVAASPDPLWEIASSLHRLQTSTGRWAYSGWYRKARSAIAEQQLTAAVHSVLIPLFPRATYFPDFLTPAEASQGLESGLAAILDTPPARVRREIGKLAKVRQVPTDLFRFADKDVRADLVAVLRKYHNTVIIPHGDTMQARIDAERALRGRDLLRGGTEGLLCGLGRGMRWRPPVLEVEYVGGVDRDLRLNGRGLLLIPSYFCWQQPVSFADPDLPPVLLYPLLPSGPEPLPRRADAPLPALLGHTRAAVLRAVAHGATNNEVARAVGVSPGNASRHTTVLRDAGLIASHRHANTVLHTLTPVGAALLGLSCSPDRTSTAGTDTGHAAAQGTGRSSRSAGTAR
ncbi:winged helix-turn-helix domain-containing protein [Streptomyces sp. S.PNR 29]|uniref:ArsR/SmtB family transcription factor n=1 Tax=Streptomyces sp. S.PNR 29 TaxID=2973805 RepID=UPI0025B0872B|nr:winged helix-turn-helix domain-containing protein [Streptomyces sp. S.PNR 29]MDN0194442.1 winged helix-turn-helix domain-containing protein [Streptomyces sp. S.PNR 29]